MTRRQALALTLAGVALAPEATSAIAQTTVPLPRTALPTRTALNRLGLEKAWYAAVPMGISNERVLTMNLAEDMVFVQTNMANLHAYEAETGKYLWGASLGRRTFDARPISVNSDRVFATNGPILLSLDRRTGRTAWTAQMEGTAVGSTAATEERVMVGLASGKLVAYNVRDHTQDNPPGRSAGSFTWAWQTGATITARPVPADRVVAFASQDGYVYVALDNPHTLLYRYLTGGPIIGSLGTFGTRTLIVPSTDRTLYGVDLFTGETLWTVPTGAALEQEPIVSGDTVYVLNAAGRLLAIDPAGGAIRWDANIGRGRILAVGATRLYGETRDHDLGIIDRSTGKMLVSPRETRERAGLDLRD